MWSVQDAQLASLVTEPLQLLQEQQLQSQQEGGPPLPFSIQLHIHVTSPSQPHPTQITTPTESSEHYLHTSLAPSVAQPSVTIQQTALLVLQQSSQSTKTSAPAHTTFCDTTSQDWFASPAQSATAVSPHSHHHMTQTSSMPAAEHSAQTSIPQPSSEVSRKLSGGPQCVVQCVS